MKSTPEFEFLEEIVFNIVKYKSLIMQRFSKTSAVNIDYIEITYVKQPDPCLYKVTA